MPPVPQVLARLEHAGRAVGQRQQNLDLELPENQPVVLPSALDVEQRALCVPGLVAMETRLREGQLSSALDALRSALHSKARDLKFKSRNIRHQRPNTRAQEKIASNEAKVLAAAEKYRAAWRAKKALVGEGLWTKQWRELKRSDVRCLKEDSGHAGSGPNGSEGRRSVSWIWMSADGVEGEHGMVEGECYTARYVGFVWLTDALRL